MKVLSSDLAKFWLTLWTFRVRVWEEVQSYVRTCAGAICVSLVGELVIDEDDHELARDSETIW
jgi:hypothetical protein